MSSHPIRAQIADVVAQGPTGKWRGSGYLVADGWVLTAQHVVAGATRVAVWLGAPTRLDPAGRRDVDLAHALVNEGADLALLPIPEGVAGSVEPALFGRLDRDSAAPVPAVAAGCPRFKLRADPATGKSNVRDLHVAQGTITPASNAKTGAYELAVTFRPTGDPQDPHSPWESMSGAAVWADQRIIGVVAQQHPDEGTDVLTVKPLETLFTSSTGWVDQWCTALGPGLPKRPGDLWLVRRATAGEAEVQQAREIAARYSPEQLLERDEELAALDNLLTSNAHWCWIQGETFAGKTALLAWVATHPPPGFTVVSCFLRSTTGENTASYALSTLNGQLAAVANRVDHQESLYFSEQKIQLHTLLANAARSCQERGRRLVVIIDGLDEHEPHGNSLKKWLIGEAELPQNVTLVAASRTGVEVELPVDHPLRGHVRTLTATQTAVELRELAEEELHQALAAKNRLEYTIAGFIAAAIGGLALRELIELLHRTDPAVLDIAVTDTLATSFYRTLIPTPTPTGRVMYVFAHAAHEQTAREWLAKDLPKFESTMLSWCDDHRDRNFSEDTPEYVLSHYPVHLYAAARTNQLPIQAADATAEALSSIYSNMPYVERVVITLGIDHLMRTMRSLVSREELTYGINDALNSLLHLFVLEAPHLRNHSLTKTTGYVVRQLALQSLAVNNQRILRQAQQYLTSLQLGQIVPLWSTTRANSALTSIFSGHLDRVTAVKIAPNGNWAVTTSSDRTAQVWDLQTGDQLHLLKGHTDEVWGMTVTSDGCRAVTAGRDGTAQVWDLNTGNQLHLLRGHTEPLKAVAVTPDGTRAVTTSSDRTARVWDLNTGNQLHLLKGHTDGVWAVSVTPDGTRAVSTSSDRTARVWDLNTGNQLHLLKGHTDGVWAVSVTPDGTRAVTTSSDGTARVWDLNTGEQLHLLKGHTAMVSAVVVTPDGTRAVTASWDRTARVWDLATGDQLHLLEGHTAFLNAVAVTPDGTRAITASRDRTARVWDLATGDQLHLLEGHTESLDAVAVTPDGTYAVTTSWDGTARVWNLTINPSAASAILRTGHNGDVLEIATTLDGTQAVTASRDRTVRVWDLDTGDQLHLLKGHTDGVWDVAVTPDGTQAVTTSSDGTARVWDLNTEIQLHVLKGHTRSLHAVAVTPDGTQAVTTSSDKTARVWDLNTGGQLHILKGHTGGLNAVAVAPDSTRAVTTSRDRTARVWDLKTGNQLHSLEGHTEPLKAVTITPDGTHAVTTSSDKTVRVWDLSTGDQLKILKGHTAMVSAVAVTPDGTKVVTASADRTARVWDLKTGDQLKILKGHTALVWAVVITPDSTRAVTASADRTIRVWELVAGNPGQVINIGNTIRSLAVCHTASVNKLTIGDSLGNVAHFSF